MNPVKPATQPAPSQYSAAHKGTPCFLIENHDEAYYLWRDAGVLGIPVIHVDPHHDMWPIPTGGATTIGSYLFRALQEEIVTDIYWVVPDASFARSHRDGLLRNLRQLRVASLKMFPDRFECEYFGHKLLVTTAAGLPSFDEPVLLDVDVDYFLLPVVSAPEVCEVPEYLPWKWPADLVSNLPANVAMLTVAYSVNGGTTSLRWKHLGEDFADRFMGKDQRLDYFNRLRHAARAYAQNACAILKCAGDLLPSHPAAHFHMAEAHEMQGDLASARESYARALVADSSYDTPYNCGGPVLEERGETEAARLEYDRMLRIAPREMHAMTGLARCAALQNDWVRARRLAETVLEVHPSSIEAHRVLADAALRIGDTSTAIREYERYLGLIAEGGRSLTTSISTHAPEQDAFELQVRVSLSQLYWHCEWWTKAEEQLRWLSGRAVPDTLMSSLAMRRARALANLGQPLEAAKQAVRLVTVMPTDLLRVARKFARMRSSSTSVIGDAAVNMSRTVVTSFCSLACSAIIARSLSLSDMGTYSYALWISGLLAGLCHFGLPTAITKFVSEVQGKGNARASAVVRVAMKVQVILLICIMLAAAAYFVLRSANILWFLAVFLVAPLALQQAMNGALVGMQNYLKLSRISACSAVGQLALVTAVALLRGGAGWFFVAAILANSFTLALYVLEVKSAGLLSAQALPRGTFKTRDLFRFSAPVAYLVLLDLVVWQRSENWFLQRYSMWHEIAIYSVAYLIVARIGSVLVSATDTLLPMQSKASVQSGTATVGQAQTRVLCCIQVTLLPLCIGIALFARPLIELFYGEAYGRVWPVLLILLVSPLAESLTMVSIASLYSLNKQRSLMVPLTFTALLNLSLAYALVPEWGAIGAAIANSIAQLAEGCFLLTFSTLALSLKSPWVRLIRMYLVAATCFAPAAIALLYRLSLWYQGAIAAMCLVFYCIGMLYLGELEFDFAPKSGIQGRSAA